MLQLFTNGHKTKKSSQNQIPWLSNRAKDAIHRTNESITAQTTAGNHKVGFEDILVVVNHYKKKSPTARRYWLINTLSVHEQSVLLPYTIPCHLEEGLINEVLDDYSENPSDYYVVIYGKNNVDDTVDKRFKQLIQLGFPNVFVYYGGLFEWNLLRDIYGNDRFELDAKSDDDPLRWAPPGKFRTSPPGP